MGGWMGLIMDGFFSPLIRNIFPLQDLAPFPARCDNRQEFSCPVPRFLTDQFSFFITILSFTLCRIPCRSKLGSPSADTGSWPHPEGLRLTFG